MYRARDTRLGRELALKVIPESVAAAPEALRRFEREARAASALNHPNIVTLHDVGRAEEVSYIAMELVDGSSLRNAMDGGAMPMKRLLALAAQIADGLAAAHEKGIVHRDLKPENVMIDRQGRAKILDFGLAKDAAPAAAADALSPTVSLAEPTREGTILGTAAYMSPEQASAAPLDFRTDQFSLGAILYEMATGVRAFRGETMIETLAAVIREEPPSLRARAPEAPAPFVWIVERCLAKNREDRYGSTRDLARDLAALRDHVTHGGSSPALAAAAVPRTRRMRRAVLGGAAAVVLAAAAFLLGGRRAARPATFDQVTFRRGRLVCARFAPGGDSIVYGAAWEGRPFEIFTTRGSAASSRPLGLAATDVLSVSRTGEMAVSVGRRLLGGFLYAGTLARADLSGGAPREMLENVFEADWTPDGAQIAITRPGEKGFSLELPAGKVLFSTDGWIGQPRVSPDGRAVAFIHHPVAGDDRGEIALVDRAGKVAVLSTGWASAQGLAWRPDGREIWFTGSRSGVNRGVFAVTRGGRVRTVATMAASLVLQDIAPSGRVLLTRVDLPVSLVARPRPDAAEVNLTWLDASIVRDVAPDGSAVVFTEAGEGGGPNCSVFLRRIGEPEAVRLGEGWAQGLSPDGRSVLAIEPAKEPGLFVYPVGPGEARSIVHPGIADERWAAFLPDGKRIAFAAHEKGRGPAVYVQDAAGGPATRVTPAGIGVGQIESPGLSLSPDGVRIAALDAAGVLTIFRVDGGAPKPVAGARPHEIPVGWSRDGAAIFVSSTNRVPDPVARIRLADGMRESWRELAPSDPAGVGGVDPVVLAPDGGAYAYSCLTYLSTLFVADGLR